MNIVFNNWNKPHATTLRNGTLPEQGLAEYNEFTTELFIRRSEKES